jgi:hypothetical protein
MSYENLHILKTLLVEWREEINIQKKLSNGSKKELAFRSTFYA